MLASLQPAIESAGLRYQNLIVWNKQSMGLGTGFRAQHELILHFTYGSPEYHSKGTGNVLTTKRVTADDREHQTQKPDELIEKVMRVVSPPGGVVLDCFAGSGTVGVVAERSGRRFIGVERDLAHVETTIGRIEEAGAAILARGF
jgi:site-specific DNA-methyltransferase (adenine-specific)